MSDPNIGFNVQLPATISNDPRYKANAAFLTNMPLVFPTDYTGSSPNVILAPIAIDDWMESGTTPKINNLLMQIYVMNAINEQRTKGLIFDGRVTIGIECHITWPAQIAKYDYDAAPSAVEDTIFTIFNTVLPVQYQTWSHGVIYNGRISIPMRTPMRAGKGASGWMQGIALTAEFGLQKK
jgi:hypothetical protein